MMAVVLVSAINAKTVEVTFNQAVDTEKATVELLKGTFKQNVTVNWAEDKMAVQLVGANNFQAGDYTVNVKGLTEEALTKDFKIEAQKVASIEILDEVAVLDKALEDGKIKDGTKATVSYIVKDQYGTDITKTTTLTTNDAATIKAIQAKGIVELSGAAVKDKKLGDLVPVVLIDSKTGISTSKTVTLSATSTVSEMEVAGIYNVKGEEVTLNDKSKAADAFLVLNLKDQYGKEITNVDQAKGLVITNTNNTILKLKENAENKTVVESMKIDGKDKLVVKFDKIEKAGNVDILFISTTNGKSIKYTVAVEETTTTDEISVSQPEIAVAKEELLIPITVTDKAGNVITDKKLLANETDKKGIKVGNAYVKEAELEVKDGQVYYKTTINDKGTKALVFQTSTFKVATLTLDVKAEAVATVVRGLKDPLVISKAQGSTKIKVEDHLVIEDQYGRAMEKTKATDELTPVKVSLVGTSDVVEVNETTNTVTALKNGTAKLKIKLETENGDIDSAVEVTVRVTDGKEYTGYEIAPIGKTQAGVAKKFTVNGILNGGKVALESSEYTVEVVNAKGAKVGTISEGKITIAAKDLDKKDPKVGDTEDKLAERIDTEFTLKVVVNATGKVLEQKFVVSADDPKVQEFFFTTESAGSEYKDAKAVTEVVAKGGQFVINTSVIAGEKTGTLNVATVDQYNNKKVTAIDADAVTIVPEDITKVDITNNGKAGALAKLLGDNQEAKLTVTVKIGNATKDLKVTLKSDAADQVLNYTFVANEGDKVIDTEFAGTINIDGVVTGNLTVNAPNATVNNNATVSGTITITAVSTATWNQNVKHDQELIFNAAGKTLNIKDGITINELTLNAAGSTVNVGDTTVLTKAVNVKAPVTIISKAPVKAKIDKDVILTVKADKDAEAATSTGTKDEPSEETVGKLAVESVSAVNEDNEVTVTFNREVTAEDNVTTQINDAEAVAVTSGKTAELKLAEGENTVKVLINDKVVETAERYVTVEAQIESVKIEDKDLVVTLDKNYPIADASIDATDFLNFQFRNILRNDAGNLVAYELKTGKSSESGAYNNLEKEDVVVVGVQDLETGEWTANKGLPEKFLTQDNVAVSEDFVDSMADHLPEGILSEATDITFVELQTYVDGRFVAEHGETVATNFDKVKTTIEDKTLTVTFPQNFITFGGEGRTSYNVTSSLNVEELAEGLSVDGKVNVDKGEVSDFNFKIQTYTGNLTVK